MWRYQYRFMKNSGRFGTGYRLLAYLVALLFLSYARRLNLVQSIDTRMYPKSGKLVTNQASTFTFAWFSKD